MSEGPPSTPSGRPSSGASDGWAVLSTLIAGLAVWGGIGYGLDRALGTSAFLPVGALLGIVCAIYLVYVRYGR